MKAELGRGGDWDSEKTKVTYLLIIRRGLTIGYQKRKIKSCLIGREAKGLSKLGKKRANSMMSKKASSTSRGTQ